MAELTYRVGAWRLEDNQRLYVVYAPFIVCSAVFYPMFLWSILNAAILSILSRYNQRFAAPFERHVEGIRKLWRDPGYIMCLITFVLFFGITVLLMSLGSEPISLLIRYISGF
ncbi:MAG: hypothetical protein J1E63_07855 [Muribaculaceae bacterium]|nr:hypothetical protein [Muribaculaceae bacterium]